MSGATTPISRRSSINRSTRSVSRRPAWRSSSLATKNSPTSSLSIIVAEPEQGAPLKSASESVTPLASEVIDRGSKGSITPAPSTSLPPYSPAPPKDLLKKSSPLVIPVSSSSSASSSEGSPPPFVSTVPKTPPSYDGIPQSSSTPPDNFISSPRQRASIPNSPSSDPITALNPSSTRSTLGIPLLGRSKVPLEKVLGSGESKKRKEVISPSNGDHSRNLHSDPSKAPSSKIPSTSPPVQPSDESDPRAANGLQDSSSSSEVATTTPATMITLDPTVSDLDKSNPSTSWWSYVGWTSTATTTSTPPMSDVTITPIEISVANEGQQLKPTTLSSEIVSTGAADANSDVSVIDSSSAEGGLAKEVELVKEVEQGKLVEPVEVQGGDRRQVSNSSSPMWYVPWGWYSSTNTGGPVRSASESLETKTISEDTQVDVVLPIAQDPEQEPAIVASSEPLEGPAAFAHVPVNPITTSLEANWGGWASFFSSKALLVKKLGYRSGGGIEDVKRDENGMEIMEIDIGDDEQIDVKDSGQPSPPPVTQHTLAKTKPLLLKTSDSDTQSSDSTGNKEEQGTPKLSAKSNISTPNKGNSGSNTPIPIPISPSPSRDGNQSQSLPNTPTPSTINQINNKGTASPAPSKKSISPPPPNLVLPTWEQMFNTAPRNVVPATIKPYLDGQGIGGKLLGKTMRFVSGMLFTKDTHDGSLESDKQAKGKEREISRDGGIDREIIKRWEQERFKWFGKELPKMWQIEEATLNTDTTPTKLINRIPNFGLCSPESTKKNDLRSTNKKLNVGIGASSVDDQAEVSYSHGVKDVLRGCKRVVVIGVHGWFPGTMLRTVVGEPTGTSVKFANMMEQALQQFEDEYGVKLEKITKIPLEGDGTIDKRVERLYSNLISNESWMTDLHEADAIIVSSHSQGSIVSTHILNRLIQDNHITTARNHQPTTSIGTGAETFPSAIGVPETISSRRGKVQRVCCLALCGVHLGPLRYLSSSTFVQPYIHYFETIAARELFEFQNTESAVSKAYVKALQNVLDHGIKMLYIASLNDQVVPIYSGLFTAVSHPLILRALYIDGDAYHSSDFLSNLLVLLIRILNSGISDSGLIAHLSEATAGSLIGVGHSSAYEEPTTFSLAVKYLFLANDGVTESTELHVEPFNANQEQNDYEIPWSLRDIVADERVSHFFSRDIAELRDVFREWHPKTSILRDLKRKLQPITRLPRSPTVIYNSSGSGSGISKL